MRLRLRSIHQVLKYLLAAQAFVCGESVGRKPGFFFSLLNYIYSIGRR